MVISNSRLKLLLDNTGDMALKRRASNIIEQLDVKNGEKILEVGCGDGYYLHLLSSINPKLKLSGTDYDESGLGRARKNLSKKVILKQGDLMKKLPFDSNSFDKVIMSEVCEHLPDDVKGLKEVKRVLKPGGILALTVPNHNYPFLWDPVNWILEHTIGRHISSGFWAGLWNQHERLYEEKQIVRSVEDGGLRVLKHESLTWWCLPFNHYIVNIVARKLAAGTLSSDTAKSLSKYSVNPKRSPILDFAFWFVNKVDSLNDFITVKNKGVSVFVLAQK